MIQPERVNETAAGCSACGKKLLEIAQGNYETGDALGTSIPAASFSPSHVVDAPRPTSGAHFTSIRPHIRPTKLTERLRKADDAATGFRHNALQRCEHTRLC
jgi:hypothetical protein